MGKRPLNRQLGVLVLAAGAGTRMESELAKVLHSVAGETLLSHVLRAARSLQPARLAIVIGHQGEKVRHYFSSAKDVLWVVQREMRGTGDAVRSAYAAFRDFEGSILILYGDIPGIRSETLRRLRMVHSSSQNAVTLLTTDLDDPTGYGRILLEPDGTVARIVEEKDASEDEREIQEINTGIGIWESKFLFSSLKLLEPSNRQKEFYLTDLVGIARKAGKAVGRLRLKDPSETLGVNSREDLAEVSRIFFEDKAMALLKAGVTFEDPATASIEPGVEVGRDTTIGAQVVVRGKSRIGLRSTLVGAVEISESEIGNEVRIGHRVTIENAKIGPGSSIGAGTTIGSRKE